MADDDPVKVRFRQASDPPKVDDPDAARADKPTTPLARPTPRPVASEVRPDKPTTPFERRSAPSGQWSRVAYPDDTDNPSPNAVALAAKLGRGDTTAPPAGTRTPPTGQPKFVSARTEPGVSTTPRPPARAPTHNPGFDSPAPPPPPVVGRTPTGTKPIVGRVATPPTSPPPTSRNTPPAGLPASDSGALRAASSSGMMRALGATPPSPAVTRASTRLGLPTTINPATATLFVEPDDPIATTETCHQLYRLVLETSAAIFEVVEHETERYNVRSELDRNATSLARLIAQGIGTGNMMQRRSLYQQARRVAADCGSLMDVLAGAGTVDPEVMAAGRTTARELVAELTGLSAPPRR